MSPLCFLRRTLQAHMKEFTSAVTNIIDFKYRRILRVMKRHIWSKIKVTDWAVSIFSSYSESHVFDSQHHAGYSKWSYRKLYNGSVQDNTSRRTNVMINLRLSSPSANMCRLLYYKMIKLFGNNFNVDTKDDTFLQPLSNSISKFNLQRLH
jgi:hypothetical protein